MEQYARKMTDISAVHNNDTRCLLALLLQQNFKKDHQNKYDFSVFL